MSFTPIQSITEDDFQEEVTQASKPVLVDFWMPRCTPCAKMEKDVLGPLSIDGGTKVKIVKINAFANQALAGMLGIRTAPTFLLYRDGEVLARRSGYVLKGDFEEWLASCLSREA